MSETTSGLAQSIHTRLILHAQSLGVDPNLLIWLGETIRPARDADLLGFGDLSDETLAAMFAEVCSVNAEPVFGAAARAGNFRFVWQAGGTWTPSPRREGVAP